MPDSEVIRVMRDFKRGLLASERTQMREMARRWLAVERALDGNLAALAERMAAVARDGGTITNGMLYQEERYRSLIIQLRNELGGYSDYAERTIADRQRQLVSLGVDHAEQSIRVQGIRAGFNRLPVSAVQNMVGLAGDGSPLRQLLVATWPDAADGLTNALIRGVALGYNPRKVARDMARGTARSLDRMMVVARNETLRVYRTASLESYKASGVVTSYLRLSARDNRVCAACLAADSTEYDLAVDFQSHVQCRCTLIPKIEGIPLRFQSGTEWFTEQDTKTQREILGDGKYDLWANGSVDFSEFATIRHDATWGDAVVPTLLRDLVR